MDMLLADLRYALRLMRRAPIFSAVTVGTLALGIGANTAIFSVVDRVLIRALPYSDPDRIVMVWEDAAFVGFPHNTPAPANFYDWQARNRVFSAMAATRGATANLTTGGAPEQLTGRRVTGNFFLVLGTEPLIGRTFTEAEEDAPLAVISYGLWQRRFGGDPSIVGRTLDLNGLGRTVVGVMRKEFAFRDREVDVWLPIQFTPEERATRTSHFLNVVARVAPGVTIEQARDNMTAVAADLAREYPDTNRRIGAVVVPVRDDVLGDTRGELLALMGAAGCVLLIACANLAGLLLSRGVARRGEMAVRAALGAGQRRLVRQLIVEAMVLAFAGGALGLALAPAARTLIDGLVPTSLPAPDGSPLDARLLMFALGMSVLTGVLFSLIPAWQASRVPLNDALSGVRAETGTRHTRVRDALVVAQVAAALVLCVGAGLMVQTLANLRGAALGFEPAQLLTMRTSLPLQKYTTPVERAGFYDRVVAGVRALPGVRDAAYVSTLPFASQGNTAGYEIEGHTTPPDDPRDALYRASTPDYLRAIGATLIEGRLPEDADLAPDRSAAVINETFARMYWPGASALGHRIRFGSEAPWRTIIGVVRDIRERGYDLAAKPGVYVPFGNTNDVFTLESLVIRHEGNIQQVAAGARRVVAEADPEQAVAAIRPMQDVIDLSVVDRRHQTALIGSFGALALLLAALGLYGVLAYAVTNRRREIGLRMALGASRSGIVRLVVRHGAVLTAMGLTVGVIAAWIGSRALGTLLYGVGPTDVRTFGAVLAVQFVIALVACGLPAWRAANVEPMRVLRDE